MVKSGGVRGLRGLFIFDGLFYSVRRRVIIFMVRFLVVVVLNFIGSRYFIIEFGFAWFLLLGDSVEASRKKLDSFGVF